ncbi:hypothetical protein D3C77_602090 [compost metagenome]
MAPLTSSIFLMRKALMQVSLRVLLSGQYCWTKSLKAMSWPFTFRTRLKYSPWMPCAWRESVISWSTTRRPCRSTAGNLASSCRQPLSSRPAVASMIRRSMMLSLQRAAPARGPGLHLDGYSPNRLPARFTSALPESSSSDLVPEVTLRAESALDWITSVRAALSRSSASM